MEVEAAPLLLLLLLACLCAAGTVAQSVQKLDFNDGEVCKEEGGIAWTCIAFRKCRSAQRLLRMRKKPQWCNFSGSLSSNSIVCCRPEVAPETAVTKVGAKSQQKCREYSKSVFTILPDQNTTINHCATVEPLITNGKKAEPREYPHMALLGYGEKPKVEWLCGGSLISERFVLSAAHCSDGGKNLGLANWVRLGEYNTKSDLDERNGLAQADDYRIVERVNHPGYDPKRPYDDISLYRLERNVQFNEFIRPSCLHTSRTFAKTYAIATGWGYTEWGGLQSDILQKGNLTIAQSRTCIDAWRSLFNIRYQTDEGIRDTSQMCAGDVEKGVDTCQGDSGGPLQLRLRDPYCMYGVIGVTSVGSRCGGNVPGVYTRVSHYVQWIESAVWP